MEISSYLDFEMVALCHFDDGRMGLHAVVMWSTAFTNVLLLPWVVLCSGGQWRRHGGLRRLVPLDSKSRQKLSKKNDIKLVGYTFREENDVRILPTSFDFFRAQRGEGVVAPWCNPLTLQPEQSGGSRGLD